MDTIAGRVIGGRPGELIVLYARSGSWWVQPLANQPFTAIQANSKWRNSTHLGDQYAALLVEPTFQPPLRTDVLPASGNAVVTVAVVNGRPPFWQTWWFRTSSIAFILLLVWCGHLYRLGQLAKQFNIGLAERVSERTRIARELHDTLLQSFQGLLLRFQAISDALPAGDHKQQLETAIDLAAQAITEGRDAVQALRSSTVVSSNLAASVTVLGEELAGNQENGRSTMFQVEVEGAPRAIHPVLRDEVYRIAGEALRNAFVHAQARRVEVDIRYDRRQLRLRVRDDGKGIDPNILREGGRIRHFGLRGMRERAKVIGAQLDIWSECDSGTEVELRIPASRAYVEPAAERRLWF